MAKIKQREILLEHGAIPWVVLSSATTLAPHLLHLPTWLSVLTAFALFWRIYLWRANQRLPHRWLLIALVVASCAFIGIEFKTFFGRDVGVALLVLFSSLKPMEMRTQRDALVAVMLGYFLLLTHFFYSQSIETGIWLLGSFVVVTATLIRIYSFKPSLVFNVRYAGMLLAQASPVMLILFILFPRVPGPLWGLPQDAYSGLSGLSNEMSPGSISNLIQSGEIAFRVQFEGNTIPARSQLYWRGPVFDVFDGITWRPYDWKKQTVQHLSSSGKTWRYAITMEPNNTRWLLPLDIPAKPIEGAFITPAFEMIAAQPTVSRLRYSLTSVTHSQFGMGEGEQLLQRALQLPKEFNPKAIELAKQWKATYASTEEISTAALRLFRSEPFYYTLTPPLLGKNSIDEFLFSTRRGFCEHYAGAYVFLMRAAGIPARVVTGYQGGEINPIDQYLTVRQSDAHAWAEIWSAKQGWIRIDPTAAVAPNRVERGLSAALSASEPLPYLVRSDAAWLRFLRNRFEATNNMWNQWVLGYNDKKQKEFLAQLGLGAPNWQALIAMLTLSLTAVVALLMLWSQRNKHRIAPEQQYWLAYCQALTRLGIKKELWEGPQALMERVEITAPQLAPLTRRAVSLYIELHYNLPDANLKQRLLTELKNCVKELKRGRFNPGD